MTTEQTMQIDLEDQLSAGMREHAAGLRMDTDLLGDAYRAHRRGLVLRRSLYGLGMLGLAGTLAAGLAIGAPGGGTNHRSTNPPAAAATGSPQLQLAAVVAASTSVSYQVQASDTLTGAGPTLSSSTTGAFDPASKSGWLRQQNKDGVYEQRLINGDFYIGIAEAGRKVWVKERKQRSALDFEPNLGGAAGSTADPEGLLDALRGQHATVTQAAGDRYHFLVSQTAGADSTTLEGDVTVGSDGRIASLKYVRKVHRVKLGKTSDTTETVTMTLSDYGVAVHVDEPAGWTLDDAQD